MNGWWRLPYDFWTKPVRAEPLALFRILLGTTYLAALLIGLAPELDHLVDLCPAEALDGWLGKTGRVTIFRAPAWLPESVPSAVVADWNAWGARPSTVRGVFAVLVVAVAGMTAGCYTRSCTIVAWFLTVSMHNRLLWTINGGDDLFRSALFYLMVAPAGAVWSVDRWRRLRKHPQLAGERVFVPPRSVRLIQIQLCAVYFFTGLAKVAVSSKDQDWLNGVALYWVLNDVAVMRWPYHWMPVPPQLCKLASWATIAWEIGFPLFVAIRRLRPWILAAGVALHLGILISMEVGWFSPATLCWYAVFLRAEQIEAALRWLPGRRQVAPPRHDAMPVRAGIITSA